ncbi:protein of unknown function [Hyphomicrobium sp. 1Nfss2.1]
MRRVAARKLRIILARTHGEPAATERRSCVKATFAARGSVAVLIALPAADCLNSRPS